MSANTYPAPVAADKVSTGHESSHDVQESAARLAQMKSDPRFARFFADSFDVSQYIRDLLASTTLSGESRAGSSSETREVQSGSQSRLDGSSSGEVSKAVTELGEVIKSQIVAYKKPLLRQAINVIQLDKWLSHVRQNVQDFNDHFAQVRTDLREPFDALSLQGKQISKAHQVSRMLRSVNLFMVQLSRLKRMLSPLPSSSSPTPSSSGANNDASPASMEISANLSYAASLIHELLSLVETERIRGIDIIDRELPWVSELKQLLEDRAIDWMSQLAPTTSKKTTSAKFVPKHLDAATSSLIAIPTLTEAIHILYSLHSLDTALKKVLENRMFLTSQHIQASLDVSTVKTTTPKYTATSTAQESATSSSTATLAEQRRLALWSQLDTLFRDTFPSHLECLLTLHRALVSLWKRSQQQTPDDRSDKMRTDPLDTGSLPASMFEEPSFALGENSSTLHYFLRRLIPKTIVDLPKDMQALINATDAGSIVTYMWNEVVESEFCDSVLRATRKAKQTEQILSTDFPRFLRLFHAFAEHSSVVLERSGFSFAHLQRNYAMNMMDQNGIENNSPPSHSLSASSLSTPRSDHSKQFHFVRRPTALHRSTTEDVSASMPSSDNSVILNLSKMELLIGNQLWTSISTRLQPIELEYQKILVAQFFTPINGMFAVSAAPATSAGDKSSLDKWQIFGPLGSGGKSQKGGVVVGGRLLLPGEVILALSSKSDSNASSAFGRWVGGSPYICKWLSLVRSHFESLQSASPALVRVLLPKFLMALNKSIKLFILKTEEVISHEEEASQISEMPPISQRFNAAVYNAIASVYSFFYKHIYSSIETQWSSHTTEPHMIDLAKALSSFSTLASQHLLQPVFSRANNLISKCLFVDLHQTDWNSTSNASSLYLRTLQRIISHLSSYILPLFSDHSKLPSQQHSSLLEAHCSELGTSIASDYILSISLIRHVNDTTKMRIISDATQVEQICQQLEQLFADSSVDSSVDSSAPDHLHHGEENANSIHSKGKRKRPASSALLHGFREIIFSDASSLREAIQHISSEFLPPESRGDVQVQHSNLVEALKILFPASVWHLALFRASVPENLSPHTQKNMSVRQYCDWLKKTPTQQVWNLFVWGLGEARKTPQLPEEAINTFDLVESLGVTLMAAHDRAKEEKQN